MTCARASMHAKNTARRSYATAATARPQLGRAFFVLLFCACACLLTTGVAGQIESVTSFKSCIEYTDPDTGQEFACTSGVSTEVTMRIESGQQEDNVRSFSARLTVVPSENSGDTQQGSGIDCPSTGSTPCQPTTPANITVSVGEAVMIWELVLTEIGEENGAVPYAHYTNPAMGVLFTDDPAVPTVAEVLATGDATCVLAGVTSGKAPTSAITPLTAEQLRSVFTNAVDNDDHIRCDATYASAPRNDGTGVAQGMMQRSYVCTHTCVAGSGTCQSTMALTMTFVPLGPTYGAYKIRNPPLYAAEVNVTLEALPVSAGQPPLAEALTVRTIATNGAGSIGVTSPGGAVAVQIVGQASPTGGEGPYIPGYIVMGTSVPGAVLDMTSGLPGIYSNPWTGRRLGSTATCTLVNVDDDDGGGLTETVSCPGTAVTWNPRALSPMTGGDRFAMAYYVNTTGALALGSQCQQTSPLANTFENLPRQATFTSESAPAVTLASIVPQGQGGTALYTTDVLCVPGFGLGLGGMEDVKTPADVMGDLIGYDIDAAAAAAAGEPIPRFAPHMPYSYDPELANGWIGRDRDAGSVYMALKYNKPITFDLLLDISGDSISYEPSVADGDLDPGATSCLVGVGRVGEAGYRVCNNAEVGGLTGNYRVTATCGISTQFDPITKTFALPAGAFVTPATIFLTDVAPGQCASIGYGATDGSAGTPPFYIQITSTTIDDDTTFMCAVQVQSDDSVTPGSVRLDTATATCLRQDGTVDSPVGFDPSYTYYAGGALDAPAINRTAAANEIYAEVEAEIEQDNADDKERARIIAALAVGGFVVTMGCLAVAGVVMVFVQFIRSRRLDKLQQQIAG